jgi:hypothetical protein
MDFTSEPDPMQSEDSSADVNELAASKMVQTGIALLMEDDGLRGYLDLRRWLTAELDKAYQGWPL